MLKYVVACENPCLIWMQTHMVGAYAENHEKIYFYDNTIGLVICKGMKSLKSWVEWVCDYNGEIVVWNDPKKQVTWKGIECLG